MQKLLPLIALFVTGCATSEIVPYSPADAAGKPPQFAPVPLESVGIFRSTIPFVKFKELGLISVRGSSGIMATYYEWLRKDAAAYGAQAVVKVRMTNETHAETHSEERCFPRTDCDANGNCTTNQECHSEDVTTSVTTYLLTGSMIREAP